jgi:hypothetical protein
MAIDTVRWLPVRPAFDDYRGSKENRLRKAAEFNSMAQRVADHVNSLAANDPHRQQYMFASIARDLGLTTDQVRSALPDGGYNGITLSVRGA